MLSGLSAALLAFFTAMIVALIAQQTKISEFRQAWINNLRNDIALYITKADEWISLYYKLNEAKRPAQDKVEISGIVKNIEARNNATREKLANLRYEAFAILRRIEMMFKPGDNEELLQSLSDLINPGKQAPDPHSQTSDLIQGYQHWKRTADICVRRAREMLKQEWEVAKQPWIYSAFSSFKDNSMVNKIRAFINFLF